MADATRITHLVVGEADRVPVARAALAVARSRGQLVSTGDPAPVARPVAARRSRRDRVLPVVIGACAVTGGALVIAAAAELVIATMHAVVWLVANLGSLGAAAAVVLALSLLGGAGCAGLHCGGCKG